jgi:copper chaperone CopZ
MKPAKQSWALAGGFLSALLASLCCLGPFLAVTLGLGGFAASSWFARGRPYFLAGALSLLGLAWYLTYRRPKRPCAEGQVCAVAPGRRASRIALWIVTALAVPAALFPWLASRDSAQAAATPAAVAGGTELRVRIPTMDCVPCAKGIEATLRRRPGVLRADVDYASKNAVIVFDAHVTSASAIVAAIDETGFKAESATTR